MIRRWILLTAALIFLIDGASAVAQSQESVLSALKPRDIGPALMGGRVSDFAVYDADSSLFYAALASGGLLKTVNAGASWENVFANQNSVSIGDVAINPTDPNTVWVGTGEANSRQSSSWGDGIYKSTDGGNTWTHLGLEESHYIGRIVINPVDTDIVYAAALGHLWGANAERGVYMTTDGGLTWKNVLSIDADTGAVDLAMDPFNPKILYAAMYQRRRTSWGFNGGGAGSGIYKTADGGRTWKKLTNGLPPGDNGRIGLDIYRANPNVVVAIVENKDGGVFRSEDKGGTWTKMNSLNPRPMYFSQIRIDPNDDSRIYVGGVQLHVSDDGGKTFRDDAAPNVHLDHHAFWIDPRNSNHLIDGNDGGIWVSYDRSKTWEHLNNYPIGQFYTVAVDMQQPYSVYGGMQDNASWGGPSSVRRRLGIMNQDWFQIQPCDGMYVAVDQKDAGSVYSDCQNGYIIRYDLKTGERKTIRPEAEPGEQLRWNWTSPIVVSPHDSALYIGANRLFRSTDHGHTWSAVSPDLTTKTNRETLPVMNVADKNITLSKHDGMTSFGNITTVSESAKRAGLIYVGTDDGKVQVTRDGGQNWTDLTARIAGVPKMLYVSRVFASSFEDGRVYASLDGHRSDDFNPYVYVSTDFGQTWKSIRANLPAKGPVYVIKEDTKNPDLLFVGTEFGLFASLDRGVSWNAWKSLPTVAVYDLVVHPRDYDLVVATHGRSIQVFDDISPLQQMKGQVPSDSHLFDIRAATEFIPSESGWFTGGREYVAPNPAFGAYINYYLKAAAKGDITIRISDADGKLVRELKGPKETGLHRVVWDLRTTPAAPQTTGFYFQPELTNLGPLVLPGTYHVKLSVDGREQSATAQVFGDPLVQISDADRRKLYDTLLSLTNMQITMESIQKTVRRLDDQLKQMTETMKESPQAPAAAKAALEDAVKQAGALRAKVLGGPPPPEGVEQGPGRVRPLRGRISGLKASVVVSQSVPTAAQQAQMQQCEKDLQEAVSQVNTWITTTLPNLQKQLTTSDVRPTIGTPIKVPSM